MATNKDSKKYVVGIGEALLDVFSDGTRRLGGAPLIFAYHAGKTCGNGVIVSAVGDDEEGKIIRDGLKTLHVGDEYLFSVEKHTGTVSVDDADPNDPKYTIETNCAWTVIPNQKNLADLAKNTAAVYFGPLASHCGETSKTTIDLFLKAVPNNCWKIFDVNLRHNPKKTKTTKDPKENKYTKALFSEKLIKNYLRQCNVLKVNKEELDYLCNICGVMGNLSNKKKSEAIMDLFPKVQILLLTLGEEGSAVFWRKGNDPKIYSQYYGISVEQPLNSVGAGDALAGAFIGEIINENKNDLTEINVNQAHMNAVHRSAQVCESGNSMPPVLKSDIFISYSRKDEKVVVYFCRLFSVQRWSVWRDKEKILYGDRFDKEIQEAIQNCKVVVYFSSEESNKSKYVEEEIVYAQKSGKTIIPIKLKEAKLNSKIESIIGLTNYLDWDCLYKSIKEGIIKDK